MTRHALRFMSRFSLAASVAALVFLVAAPLFAAPTITNVSVRGLTIGQPTTIVIDREGQIRARILGILEPDEFEQIVKPLLR